MCPVSHKNVFNDNNLRSQSKQCQNLTITGKHFGFGTCQGSYISRQRIVWVLYELPLVCEKILQLRNQPAFTFVNIYRQITTLPHYRNPQKRLQMLTEFICPASVFFLCAFIAIFSFRTRWPSAMAKMSKEPTPLFRDSYKATLNLYSWQKAGICL